MQPCCGAFQVPQQCTGTSDTQGVITTTNHFLVSVSSTPPPPTLSLPLSFFFLSPAHHIGRSKYISQLESRGWSWRGGGLLSMLTPPPPVPHTSPLKVEAAAAQCRLEPCQSKALRPFMQICLSVVDREGRGKHV